MRKMSETAMRTADGGKWRWYCAECKKGGYGPKWWCYIIAGNHKSHAANGAAYWKV